MLTCQRDKFNLPENVTYLNCAYMGPLLKSSEKAGHAGVSEKCTPFQYHPEHFFDPAEKLKKTFAQLINCSYAQRIALIPSVSYGIGNVTNNIQLKSTDNIVIAGEQFPSNVYPWMALVKKTGASLRIVEAPETLNNRAQAWNEKILASIDNNTRAVAIANVHWADGTKFDLLAIRKKTDENNALLIIDGTQSVGALPFDIQKIRPDAVVCAGYKWMLGAYSMGFAYYGEHFDTGEPIEHNWINRLNSEDFRGLVNYRDEYREKAGRYSVGEYGNFIHIPILQASLNQILEWGVENIQDYCRRIAEPAFREFEALGCLIEKSAYRANHLFGIRLPESVDLDKLKVRLEEENVYVSLRGNAVRVSLHLFNETKNLRKLIDCLRFIK